MRTHTALTLALSSMSSTAAFAQSGPELPAPSPKARVEQTVGVTQLSVDYSSPGVKGRTIWGGLVPYDKPWRTGANAATKLTSNKDFTFAGKAVPAGSYALYTIPTKASWTVILNSSSENWGTNGYDPKKDVARVTLKPEAIPSRERLTFIFSNTTDDGTRLDLEWEKVRLSIPIQVDTKKLVLANIESALGGAWRPHFASARWLLENNGDLDQAMGYVDTSIAVKPTWWNNWIKAQILAKKGQAAAAVASAQKAQELGKGDQVYEGFFKEEVAKAITGWKQQKS
jgi:hypothetical protein